MANARDERRRACLRLLRVSRTWAAYRNRYWPAQYLVDQTSKIVYHHAGEGAYEQIERTIQNLLKVSS